MEKFSNQLTDAELERLAILSEEMGEAQQVIGKIIRHGYESFDPARSEEMFIETKGTNRCDLEKELGDVLTAVEFMVTAKDVREMAIQDRGLEKRQKIKPYLHHQLVPAPSPGVTSEQVRVDCKACGGEQVEHTCHRKWKTIRNKSEAGVTSGQVGTCEKCGSDDPAKRYCKYRKPVMRMGLLWWESDEHIDCLPCENESFHGSLPAPPENEPVRDYDFHGNPSNLPARPELDKDEGGRDEPVGRCDVTIFGHTPAPHVEGKYCINWKPCDDSSSASGREKGGLG